MTGKRDVDPRKFHKMLVNNGYQRTRQRGSHRMYKNDDGNVIPVPLHINKMMAKRLIKENNLKEID